MKTTYEKVNIYDTYPFLTWEEKVRYYDKSKIDLFDKYSITIEGDDLLQIIENEVFDDYGCDKVSGIYFLFTDKGKLLYVGQTVDLSERLKQHLKGRSNPTKHFLNLIKYIKIIICKEWGSGALLKLEDDFIREFKPMFNAAKGTSTTEKMYGFPNLRKRLDSLENKEEIFKDIESWNICFIEDTKSNNLIIIRKESLNMDDKENEKNLFLEAIKESIKLAVKHENEENADKIIYGFLSGLSK